MERGRNLTKKFREEMIINRRLKERFQIPIDEGRTELQTVMPHTMCIYRLPLCSREHAHIIMYVRVLQERNSAIMRMGNFNIY